jgi:hypothetical protein
MKVTTGSREGDSLRYPHIAAGKATLIDLARAYSRQSTP